MRCRLFEFLRGTRSLALIIGVGGASGLCAGSDTARAQTAEPGAWGFVSTRLDSRSSNVVYTGYGYGPAFVLAALLDNPHSGYSEQIIGIGARRALGSAGSQFVVAAVAKAPESRYLQFYYLPTVAYGRVIIGTTIETYVPLDPTGVVQLAVTPLSAIVRAIGPLSVGASYEFSAEEHSATSHSAGPSLRVAVPGAELGADLLLGIRRTDGKLRLSFRAFY
jgi:hypothetical protein